MKLDVDLFPRKMELLELGGASDQVRAPLPATPLDTGHAYPEYVLIVSNENENVLLILNNVYCVMFLCRL